MKKGSSTSKLDSVAEDVLIKFQNTQGGVVGDIYTPSDSCSDNGDNSDNDRHLSTQIKDLQEQLEDPDVVA